MWVLLRHFLILFEKEVYQKQKISVCLFLRKIYMNGLGNKYFIL